MALVSLMVAYEDDSVEVQYTDGSSLQLSPCGSEFVIEKGPTQNLHPLQSSCRIRQRTPFVISTYKEQVLHALEFRNRFASRPYLPADLITADKLLNVFYDVSKVRWPGASSEGAVTVAGDGRVTVCSLGGYAFLHLSPSRHEFTVDFLARVSQSAPSKSHLKLDSAQSDEHYKNQENMEPAGLTSGHKVSKTRAQSLQSEASAATRPRGSRLEGSGPTGIHSKYMYQYTWVVQHHTVSWCPPEWRHPLHLALHYNRQQDKSTDPSGMGDHAGSPGILVPAAVPEVTTVLRSSLPLHCLAPHLHRVIAGSVTSVEIYPGDGSVLKPHDATNNYFTHYWPGCADEEGEERMYRVSSLPPDRPGSKYSICSLVTRAIRMLQFRNQLKLSLKPLGMCCWQTEEFQPGHSNQLPLVLSEKVIENVGRFLAFSNGRVHISFCNGVRLNTSWDSGSQHRRKEPALSSQWNPLILPVVLSEMETDMKPGWFQLLFPDGSSQVVQLHSAGSYERYVAAAADWCRYLRDNPQQRKSMDEPQLQACGQHQDWSVISELQKIQRFNFLLENSSCLKRETPPFDHPVTQRPKETSHAEAEEGWSVEGALTKTGRAIQDIELLLEANREVRREKSQKRGRELSTVREAKGYSG
ncbi:uncharacterized protein C5orf34 homolog isoform X2 [Mobula birostris]|uniref:uncharacterized protein C5orf34 homolog isoform X2 n=1 Tax=Mobula birostris TaxID=1983395 RepID=UPI003B27CBDA